MEINEIDLDTIHLQTAAVEGEEHWTSKNRSDMTEKELELYDAYAKLRDAAQEKRMKEVRRKIALGIKWD